MKSKHITAPKWMMAAAFGIALAGCQKMDRPAISEYPKDTNPPGGPLKFFASFDGTSADPIMNAVDSIKANFPAENPLATVDGISGKAVQGDAKKFIKYPSFNDWTQSSSFTIATWLKKNGQTKNNMGGNGPEYIMSLRLPDDKVNWSNGAMFVLFEGDNAACAIKVMCVSTDPADPNKYIDKWFEWAGVESIAGILDNNWHHIALVYDAATSGMRLYINGVANPNVKTWDGHGPMRLAASKVVEYRVGRGPRNDNEGDGESGWLQSSLKGSLDQFRLYSTVLTADQVKQLYTSKQ